MQNVIETYRDGYLAKRRKDTIPVKFMEMWVKIYDMFGSKHLFVVLSISSVFLQTEVKEATIDQVATVQQVGPKLLF